MPPNVRLVLAVLTAVVFSMVWHSGLHADDGLLLEITLYYNSGRRDFTHRLSLPTGDRFRFESDPQGAARKFLPEARKKLAVKQGYSEASYGRDFDKILNIDKWFYHLSEPRSGRVIASNLPGRT